MAAAARSAGAGGGGSAGAARSRARVSRPSRRDSAHEHARGPSHAARPAASGVRQSAGNLSVQRALRRPGAPAGPAAVNASPTGALVQRCCGGGASQLPLLQRCPCGGAEELQREASGSGPSSTGPSSVASPVPVGGGAPMDAGTRGTMESRFGRDFSGVRLHTGPAADRAAAGVSARAFTVGQDIVFGSGEYAPQSPAGQRLLAHELTHTIQQSGAASPGPQMALRVSQPGDPLEREADRVAAQVMSGPMTGAPITAVGGGTVQRFPSLDDITDAASDLYKGASDFAGDIYQGASDVASTAYGVAADVAQSGEDLVMGFARDVWDGAHTLADAISGVVSIVGSALVIDIPEIPVCPNLSFQFNLREIGKDFTLLEAAIPVAEDVEIYGEVGLHVGLTPEISAQLGPCILHGARITIDPLGPSLTASGAVTITTALGLGGELRAGLFGEVGVMIIWPEPPIEIEIPVAHIEGGLAGFARGIEITQITVGGSGSAGLGGAHLSMGTDVVIGLAGDAGLAGYGALELLGVNLCTLYWPLLDWHDQLTISAGASADLDISMSGVSLDVLLETPVINDVPFDDLGLAIPRGMFADDCPLCKVFYDLGLMPSQNGAVWKRQTPWPGPLLAFPRDPGITSGALCRGACGPDCDTCTPPEDRIVCMPRPDGTHQFWLYPNYQVCGSHEGCRQHDAGYDWCADFGEMKIWGPCHRLPDFECLCNYGAKTCVGWIFGGPPYDLYLAFSDTPVELCECVGPCPEEAITPSGLRTYELCLPEYTLMERKELFSKDWFETTGEIPLWEKWFVVPYILLPVLVEVVARGDLTALVSAGIGPIWLSDMCLDVDPLRGIYHGSAQLNIGADIDGSLELTGVLGAHAGWGCLLRAVSLEGGLTGRGDAGLHSTLIGRADVSCRYGEIVLDTKVLLDSCVQLILGLDGHFNLKLFGYKIISERWNLLRRAWDKCWQWHIGAWSVPLAGAESSFDLDRMGAGDLLKWVLATATDDRETLEQLTGSTAGAASSGAPALAIAGSTDTGGGLTMPADPAATGGTDPCALPPPAHAVCPPTPSQGITLVLPPQKARLLALYQSEVRRGNLQHKVGRDRDTDQTARWDEQMDPRRRGGGMSLGFFCRGRALGLTDRQILRPQWTPERRYPGWPDTQVDHRIEMQVSTIGNEDRFDDFWNYELLDQNSNGSSGGVMKNNIIQERKDLKNSTGDDAWLTCDLTFTRVTAPAAGNSGRWSFDQVTDGLHIRQYERDTGERPDPAVELECERRGGR